MQDIFIVIIVAPLAGAWIETPALVFVFYIREMSHPSRVRGLKPSVSSSRGGVSWSHPSRVRGLKRFEVV